MTTRNRISEINGRTSNSLKCKQQRFSTFHTNGITETIVTRYIKTRLCREMSLEEFLKYRARPVFLGRLQYCNIAEISVTPAKCIFLMYRKTSELYHQ